LDIAEAIENVGGYINAYTSKETTAYFVRVLNEDVEMAANILADILRNSVFDKREVDVERGVILQEIGQTLDTPDDIVFDWLQETAYPEQSLGRSILGPSENISKFSREDLSTFVSEHYSPDRMILSAAGGVNHDTLCKLAEKAFGDLKKPTLSKQSIAAAFSGGEFRKDKKLEQAHFALAFESPSYRSLDIYTAQVYSIALGGGMSSRLFQQIREKRGLCYSIFAQAGAFSDTGLTTIYAGTSAEQIPDLANLTVNELKRAAMDLSEVEVTRARSQMKAGLLMGLESPSSRAERLARMIQIWGKVPSLNETIEKIDSVNLEKVRTYAEHVTTHAKFAMALYGPISSAPSLQELDAIRAA
jgi:predicted Zn-dependent peptidase